MAQDEISKKVELNWLSAFYGGLLTDKQRQVLTLHCEEDLSLTDWLSMTSCRPYPARYALCVWELLPASEHCCSRLVTPERFFPIQK